MRGHLGGWAAVLLVLLPSLAAGQGEEAKGVPDNPELSVRIIPPEPYLQEQIVQVVRVVSPRMFEELDLDLPLVEGAEIVTLQQPKTRFFKTYGVEGYVYETRRAIFPKASGALSIPPVRVSGAVAKSGDERQRFDLASEPVLLDIKPPPASFHGPAWVVARRMEIEEHWSRSLDQLRVGDHVTRWVDAVAHGVTGAHLPELEHGRSPGLTILPGRTERSTEVTANEVIGRISRSFELRIDTDQPIDIGAVRLVWWNTDTEIEWQSAAKEVRLEPLPRDVDGLVRGLMTEAEAARRTGRYGVMAIIALASLGVIGFSAWFGISRRKRAPEDRILLNAVRAKPAPIDVVAALLRWGETTFPGKRPMSLERLRAWLGGDADHQLAELQKAAFAPGLLEVDTLDITQKAIAAARSQRGRSFDEFGADIARYLIGPKQHLPKIDGVNKPG